jgi:hypothetical protein
VRVAVAGQLRQVRDAYDLMIAAQPYSFWPTVTPTPPMPDRFVEASAFGRRASRF